VVRNWEQAGRWGKAVPPPPPATEPNAARVTVQEATEDFLAKCKNRHIAPNTLAKYCGGSVSSDRFFGFLGEEIVQLVVVVAVEM
jgi:hypothetical protein